MYTLILIMAGISMIPVTNGYYTTRILCEKAGQEFIDTNGKWSTNRQFVCVTSPDFHE